MPLSLWGWGLAIQPPFFVVVCSPMGRSQSDDDLQQGIPSDSRIGPNIAVGRHDIPDDIRADRNWYNGDNFSTDAVAVHVRWRRRLRRR